VEVIEIGEAFGLEHLRTAQRSDPHPGRGEIALRMSAASLNYRDLLTVRGEYNPKQPLPLIPCSDGVGTVQQVGADVRRFAPGDRVCPIFAQRWIAGAPTAERLRSTLGGPLDGTLAQSMIVPQESVVAVPEHLDDAEAAALPCAGVTAWNAVCTHGRLRAGETVLILGTGGVALFALQFANLLGARAIVSSSSDEKLARARELGAWQTINYRETPKWGKAVRELSGDGVDLVVELGGAGSLPQSIAATRFGGRISLIGNVAGGVGEINVIPILMRQLCIQGILVGSRDDFEAMNRAIAAHRMKPQIDRVFPWAEAREAFQALSRAEHFGKLCLEIA